MHIIISIWINPAVCIPLVVAYYKGFGAFQMRIYNVAEELTNPLNFKKQCILLKFEPQEISSDPPPPGFNNYLACKTFSQWAILDLIHARRDAGLIEIAPLAVHPTSSIRSHSRDAGAAGLTLRSLTRKSLSMCARRALASRFCLASGHWQGRLAFWQRRAQGGLWLSGDSLLWASGCLASTKG
jgi:hypothetical protein